MRMNQCGMYVGKMCIWSKYICIIPSPKENISSKWMGSIRNEIYLVSSYKKNKVELMFLQTTHTHT